MAGKQINQYPESTSPSGEWFVLVDDGTGCYKKVKLKNLPGGGGGGSTTTSTSTTAAGGSTTTSTSTTSPIVPTTSTTTTAAFDPDALAFFEAAGITNATEKSAVNTFVESLKDEGLWTKMKALYPFVGSNASSHLVNLKQPGTFNLTFNGGWSYPQSGGVSLGATSDGINAYADTGLNANSPAMPDIALGVYLRTTPTLNPGDAKMPIGALTPGPVASFIAMDDVGGTESPYTYLRGSEYVVAGAATPLIKLTVASRVSDTSLKIYHDGALLNTNTTLETGLNPNVNIFVGAWNSNGVAQSFTDTTFGLAFISTGLADGNVSALNTIVNTFQTALGRAV